MNYNLEAGFGRKSYRISGRGLMAGFVVGWALLTVLVLLQDRAIDAQRELIQSLLADLHSALVTSVSHSHVSSAPVVVKEFQLPSDQVHQQSAPSVQVPSHPLSKVQPKGKKPHAPSSQGESVQESVEGNSRHAAKPLPIRPPAEITDPSDKRRVTYSI